MTTDELIEKAAEAMAFIGDHDGCFERLRDWGAATEEQRQCGDVEEPLSTDSEDAEWWRYRARAAFAVFEQAQAEWDGWEYEHRDYVIAVFPRPKNVRIEHQRRLIGPWVPVEATGE